MFCHKFLEDVHEDSMQFSSQNNQFLCNCLDGPLKASKFPAILEALALQLSGRPSYTIRTIGQAIPSSTQSCISDDFIWEGSAKHPDDMATHPNATQCFRIFQASFMDAEKSDSVDRPNAVLFWVEYRYSGKAIAEDHPDAAK